MSAPDPRGHPAYAYIEAGLTIIPCERGKKSPSPVLPRKQWKQYQTRQPSFDEVDSWLAYDSLHNWGLVCGQNSVCADADDLPLAQWLLSNPTHPVLRGAALHRSGRNKAHVLFRTSGPCPSTVWHMLPGRNAGELRGDGNYVLVPPSALDGHGRYERVVGSLRGLPTIDNVQDYLNQITAAFLAGNPDQIGPPLNTSNRNIMLLSDERKGEVIVRVRALGLKKKILDTLLQPGNQDPGTRHWTELRDPSHSAIDFAVCCELVRKGWAFAEIEETFAATLVGDACYANRDRDNHGQGYLLRTYENAQKEVEKQNQAARQAQGANFKVLEATKTQSTEEARYRLLIESTSGPGKRGFVTVTHTQLLNEAQFVTACFGPPLSFVPQFLAAQAGKGFRDFASAVENMVSETSKVPEGADRLGHLAFLARRALERLADRAPQSKLDTHNLGWREGPVYWIRLSHLVMAIRASDRGMSAEDMPRVFDLLGPWSSYRQAWGDGSAEQVIRLEVIPPGSGPRLMSPSA